MRNDASLLLLDKIVVERLLVPGDVIEAAREAFLLHSRQEGRIFPVVRETLSTDSIFGIKSGDVQSQGLPLVRSSTDITVFDMTGFALQDLTVARLVHQRASAKRLGTSVAWPW